jgi:hypothetical protein
MTDYLFGPMIDNINALGVGGNVTLGNVVVGTLSVSNTFTATNLAAGGNITAGGTAAITGNTTVGGQLAVSGNIRVTGNVFAQNFFFSDGSSLDSDVYDLDDVSSYTDGFKITFALSYNRSTLTLLNPFRVWVSVNGVTQPGFVSGLDKVWFSQLLSANRGYTADSAGNLKFADPPPAGSQITVRTQTGPTRAAAKVYPFNPADVMLGI